MIPINRAVPNREYSAIEDVVVVVQWGGNHREE